MPQASIEKHHLIVGFLIHLFNVGYHFLNDIISSFQYWSETRSQMQQCLFINQGATYCLQVIARNLL